MATSNLLSGERLGSFLTDEKDDSILVEPDSIHLAVSNEDWYKVSTIV